MESFSRYEQLSWYLLKTKPRDEGRVFDQLKTACYSCLFPTYWKVTRLGRKREKRPLFPGYIFVQAVLKKDYHTLRYTRGVASFVKSGNRPAPVPEPIIEELYERMREDGTVRMFSRPLLEGEKVMISEGPFAGFEGVFLESLNDGERVALLINGLTGFRIEVNRLMVTTAL